MSPVIAGEGVFILHSFLLGVIITFIYDLFRIVRRIIPHGWFLLSLEDLAFWILATAGIFYMLYCILIVASRQVKTTGQKRNLKQRFLAA